jgi:rhodanese-related sulfurtransferase
MDVSKFLLDNIFLVGVAAASGTMLVWPMIAGGAGGPSVDNLQATLLMNKQDALLIDLRDPSEYAAGHIIGARHIPFAEVDARAADLKRNKSKPVVVYCASGTRSAAAVAAFKKNGFEQVFSLSGGLAAWKQAGLPTEKS